MRHRGIVEALLETLRVEEKPGPGKLIGRSIPLHPKGVEVFVAMDGSGQIHFLLSPAPAKTSRFSKLKLKSLSVESRKWTVSGNPPSSYLDFSCRAGLNSPFLKPFIGLCEDIVISLVGPGTKPEDAAYRTIQKWKRFWSSKALSGFTTEWLHGLHGELVFLESLLRQYGPNTVRNWTGPDGQDHDFQGHQVAFEVKTSTRMPLTVQINNLGQLDNELFETLFLACFHVADAEDGLCLPETVFEIEKLISKDLEASEFFHEKLEKAGYNPRLEEEYEKFRYSLTGPDYFLIDEEFPKIIQRSFAEPPDSRITKIRYSVELRGLNALRDQSKKVSRAKMKMAEINK